MERYKFLEKYNINSEYFDFFNDEKIKMIETFINNMEYKNIKYVPKRNNIFKALNKSISSKKIVILGMDPYKQKNTATGFAFEVEEEEWESKKINTSLKNILKLIYFSYNMEYKSIEEIRKEIKEKKFLIKNPKEIFKDWDQQGVLLLNTALTTEENISGKHIKFWKEITTELIEYISIKNNDIIYFLWGKDAQEYRKNIKEGILYESNHPAICGNLKNIKDFMNSKCFINTKSLIKWSGIYRNIFI